MIICLGTTPAVGRTMAFERVVVDSVNRAAEVHQHAAGKAINAARVLQTLKRNPLATGFLGGYSGKFIQDDLNSIELKYDFVPVAPPTRTCVTVIDTRANSATELVEEPANVGEAAYTALLAKLQTFLPEARALILSGAMPPKAPPDFYAQCVAFAVAAGIPVILDAKGEPLRRALPNHPTVIKPNRGELEETVGTKIDSDQSLKSAIIQLIAAGPQWVIVTSGSQPTVASDGKSFWRLSTPKVEVVSPIGSGDSFAAGLTAAVVAGEPVQEACKLAVACGAANAMTPFAGHIREEDVETLLPQIDLTPF